MPRPTDKTRASNPRQSAPLTKRTATNTTTVRSGSRRTPTPVAPKKRSNLWRSENETQPIGVSVGRLAHVLIGHLLTDGDRAPSLRSMMSAVNTLELDAIPSVHPYALKQQLLASAALYFRLFVPGPEWALIAREYRSGNCRFDLVFRHTAGDVVVDEVKSGRLETALERQTVEEQATRELAAAVAEWADDFKGVRVLSLGSPRMSRFYAASGEVSDLQWGARS